VEYLERHVPLHERIAFYSIANCAVVTATRDGMNLVPYEYVVCRQGPDGDEQSARSSMLVVSGGQPGQRRGAPASGRRRRARQLPP
jgi:trehalose 6-phosphate synthase/phosphatase